MTRAEALLWKELRAGRLAGWKFKRQVPIGIYVADFMCFEPRLVAELDGEPHDTPEQKSRDLARDAWLAGEGFRVLRFGNDAVLGNAGLILDQIRAALAPSPDPR